MSESHPSPERPHLLDHEGRIAEQNRQTNARLDRMEQAIAEQGRQTNAQFRWMVGIQITTLIAIGSLLFSILSKLP